MFTGIIEDKGVVEMVKPGEKSATLTIRSEEIVSDLKVGDSVAVNGVCLTVTYFDKSRFTVDAVPETMSRSNLGMLKAGSRVNLERALQVGGRMGGHMVSGHVDAEGEIRKIEKDENAVWFTIGMASEQIKYLIPKGSVAVNGISLTVVDVEEDSFTISVIPHSLSETTLNEMKTGDKVNIEVDMTAKYIERFLSFRQTGKKKNDVSMDYLKENGFA
ncbi:MAG TPA: riboflavin synthase [Bacteroidales bacterium]|nr:riboflavin synthase [Bacteroidales bacterium]